MLNQNIPRKSFHDLTGRAKLNQKIFEPNKKKSVQDIFIRRAQDKQDEIFKRMSTEEKLSLLDGFFRFAKELQKLNNGKKQ